ncbi:amino acid/peptide transporter [Gemmatirosa kalamazoonensis]|uniref:Amino acid/peptide transporter n=1 Tax=Gemmatirosa kalamazoonensis TaxID=861299 RepID=W0RIS1_9BACT|nr:peptide MFS transporter [Gemmatirosa kalamazoonensis]AHG90215.1 amino acid/peptide transporter [Gemmatirosa kalamazoonensis]
MSAPVSERPPRRAAQETGVATDSPPPLPSADRSFFGHPRGLPTVFFTEMWERFSYYGLRPLLILFMSAALADGGFGFERSQASAIVGIYAACVYLASLPGGWVADRLLGLRRAIMLGAVLITCGHLSIGLSGFAVSKVPFFLGLVLIVLGTGLLKPNISAIVGDLYPEGGARRDAGFSIFYMGINLGAFFGQIVTGALGEKVGWHWGFGAAGVGMLAGLLTFAARQRSTLGNLGTEPSRHPDPVIDARQKSRGRMILFGGLGVLALVFALAATGAVTIDAQAIGRSMTYVLVGLAVVYFAGIYATGNLSSDEKKRIAVIFVLFVFASAFWGAFEQAPTSLNLFAKDFTNRTFFGWEVPALWFQSINSLFIIIFAPVFAAVWVGMAKRGMELSSPSKFTLGLLLAAAGFAIMIPAANMIVASGGTLKVSAWWLTISYLLQTLGELSLSPVGLSSMTKLSPRKYVGQMMGIWFLAASVGNLIAGLVGGSVDPEKLEQTPVLFTGTTIALLASAAVLGALIIPIRRMMANVGDVKA